VDTGFYHGVGYNSEHVRNYHRRTIAHNCMLVYDPNEKFPGDHANDGGQRMPNDRKELKRIQEIFEDNQTGEVSAHYIGPDPQSPELSYLKGDLTRAYSPNKVREYTRSFAFLKTEDNLRPAIMVVFDRVVSVEASFQKSWLLHSIEEPEIKGNMTVVRRTEHPYNGKMVNHTLLPINDDVRIEKIGGNGKEFWVEGKNYPLKESKTEAGSWRVEISPVNPANEHLFLNVMQVMDNLEGPDPVQPELIDAEVVIGCRLLGRAAIFSKSGSRLSKPFGFEIANNDEVCHIWLFDLEPGVWEVRSTVEGKESAYTRVVSQDGTLQLQGAGGSYSLLTVKR
jgi:hypothetical protein